MLLLGIDTESTGLSLTEDRITEVGWALWDTTDPSPSLVGNGFIYEETMDARFTPDACEMMSRVCGLTPQFIKSYGGPPKSVWGMVEALAKNADYLVGHNSENFDKPMILADLNRHGIAAPSLRNLPWIDTRTDIPWDVPPDSMKLKHLALDAGFINPFPHRALFDVVTMLKVLLQHDLDKVVAYSKLPWITVRADVSYENRELAKKMRYSWEQVGDIRVPKAWIKRVKAPHLAAEQAACPFPVLVL